MTSLRAFAEALRQRKLVRWLAAYLAAAWLVLQLHSVLADQFDWPDTLGRGLTVLLAVGVLVVLIVGWYHGEKGSQRVSSIEIVMLVSVLVIAGAALRLVRESAAEPRALVEPAGLPVPAASARASIAVLPFANLSGAEQDEYFADGFSEQLIDALANNTDLRVASRTSAFAYKGSRLDVVEIARRLGVQKVLEGSVRRAGDRIRVTAQLINGADGFHIWSKTYERGASDVFAVQDELAHELAGALDVTLNEKASGTPPTRDLVAFDLYLRGIYHWRLQGFTSDSAIYYLEQATARDPRFAQAFGALGAAYQRRNFNSGSQTAEYREKAFVAIERALTLDPSQVDALVARGNMAWTIERGFNHEAAARDFRRALQINPRSSRARESLGSLYHHVGLNDRALREFRTAIELDPQSDFSPWRIPRTLMQQGRFEEAFRLLQVRPDRDRNVMWPLVLVYLGRPQEALRALAPLEKDTVGNNPEDVYALKGLVLASLGRRQEAVTQLQAAERAGRGRSHFHHAAYQIAMAYALMDRPAEAVHWLRRVAREGMPNYELFLRDPTLNSLRRHPDFEAFMEEQKALWQHFAAVL